MHFISVIGRRLCRLETDTRHPDDQPIDPTGASIGIFGMGRIGTMAYDFLREKYGETVIGFDSIADQVSEHTEAGRRVVFGDPTDPDFWLRVKPPGQTGPHGTADHAEASVQPGVYQVTWSMSAFLAMITAIAQFDDQVEELRQAGAHAAFNVYNEAGLGFAEHAWEVLEGQHNPGAAL